MVAPQELFHRLKAEGYVGIEASLPDLGKCSPIFTLDQAF